MGLRMQANAASSNERRNLDEMSMSLNRAPQNGAGKFLDFSTYSKSEPRCCWCVIWDLALAPISLPLAVPCQCQGQ